MEAIRFLHPLAMVSTRHVRRLLRQDGGIESRHRLKLAGILAGGLATAPVRAAEHILYDRRLRGLSIQRHPVFILGHWRTGTTLLHNLLAQDPNLAYVSNFQTVAPDCFLAGGWTVRPLLAATMPKKRPMDGMPLGVDLPQEEEFAIANAAPQSFYLGWYFPRRMRTLFMKYALFNGITEEEKSAWREAYVRVVKKATLRAGGRRLVLKNPVNTCRIRELLKLFPDARFIHICRDPYAVFHSTLRLHRGILGWVALQDISEDDIRSNVLALYRKMMRRYLKDRSALPPGRFTEVRFEDLERDPVREIARVYQAIGLEGWQDARLGVEAYAESVRGHAKHPNPLSPREMGLIEDHWGFAIREWGYHRPSVPRPRRPRTAALQSS